MAKIRIDVTLTFTTPPSVGAVGAGRTLADKVVTRNARGNFIIPASQMKGKLRHACEQILRSQNVPLCHPPRPDRMCPQIDKDDEGRLLPQPDGQPYCLLCRIFGSPAYPSRLRFLDLLAALPDSLPGETLRPMVSLNRGRRVAEDKRLFVIETAPNVSGLKFEKSECITGYVHDPRHLHLLLCGLNALFTWGGGTSRGLGWGKADCEAWLDGEAIGKVSKEEVLQLCRS